MNIHYFLAPRTIIAAFLCCLISYSTLAAEGTAPATAPAPMAINHGPFLQAPSPTGMTIVWSTTRNAISKVEYRAAGSDQWLSAQPVHHGLIDANVTYHKVPLSGLRPGTRYVYRVISKEMVSFQPYKVVFGTTIASEEHAFTTLDPAKKDFSFIVINDRHERVPKLREALKAVQWEPTDLAFFNGDMVNAFAKEQQAFDSVIDPSTEIFARSIPFVYVRGNHDARGAMARSLLNYFPTDSGRYYYAFDHGGARFVILDGGEDKADTSDEYFGLVSFESYLKEETKWLAEEVRSPAFKNARWRIVLVHIPPMKDDDAKFVRPGYLFDHWGPLFNQGKVDLVISGHTHRFGVIPRRTDGAGYPIIIGDTLSVIGVNVAPDVMRITFSQNDGRPKALPMLLRRR